MIMKVCELEDWPLLWCCSLWVFFLFLVGDATAVPTRSPGPLGMRRHKRRTSSSLRLLPKRLQQRTEAPQPDLNYRPKCCFHSCLTTKTMKELKTIISEFMSGQERKVFN